MFKVIFLPIFSFRVALGPKLAKFEKRFSSEVATEITYFILSVVTALIEALRARVRQY